MIVCESFRLTTNRNEVKMELKNRNYGEIVKTLENNREYHKTVLNLLENVKVNRKKDGTHFKNKNQTFENATFVGNADNTITHPFLKVMGRGKDGNWVEVKIDCYINREDLAKDDERRNSLVDCSPWQPVYLLTTDEIIEEIEREKEMHTRCIKEYDKQIEESGRIFDIVSNKLQELKDAIYNECEPLQTTGRRNLGFKYTSSLEYALKDYIRYNL